MSTAIRRLQVADSDFQAQLDGLLALGVPLDDGGVAGTRNPLNIINPNDIETFTVLKDASASASAVS